jgi:mono/diheme cytochrome c family protein
MIMTAAVVAWTASTLALASPAAVVQKTTNDGVYSKAQADAAKAQFNKVCAECHPFSVAARKKPADLPLGGDPFIKNWNGRTVEELATLIALTMPNDGSAVVTEAEAINLVAYILQQNGFPAGAKPLARSTASAVLTPPKKAVR